MALRPGVRVWIHCEVKPGAFSNERMVRVEHDDGVWFGFVDESNLRQPVSSGRTEVVGIVEDVQGDRIFARLPGDSVTSGGFVGERARVTPVGPLPA